MADVIISTGDVKKDYEVLDIIFALERSEYRYSGSLDNALESAKRYLISKCKNLGGNAVIFCQFEYRITIDDTLYGKQYGEKQGVEVFAYGTAVRIK